MLRYFLSPPWQSRWHIAWGMTVGSVIWVLFLADPLVIDDISVRYDKVLRGQNIDIIASTQKRKWAVDLCKATASFNNLRDSEGRVFQQRRPPELQ